MLLNYFMIRTFLLVLCLLFFLPGNGQKPKLYFVAYHYSQSSYNKEMADSVKKQIGNDASAKIIVAGDSTYEATLDEILPDIGKFSFDAPVYMLANKDSSRLFFNMNQQDSKSLTDNGINLNITSAINTPDTLFFKNGIWTIQRGEIKEPYDSPVTFDVTETNETKEILGYQCKKYLALDNYGKPEITIWATKELPNTLVPCVGLTSFVSAILEVEHKSDNWQLKVQKIKLLE